MKVENFIARKIIDSRGKPTIEVEIVSEGFRGRGAAPSGASRGKYEARTLPVDEALSRAKEIKEKLLGTDLENMDEFLREVDGTENFGRIGANLSIALSIASARTAALIAGKNLYEYLGKGRRLPLPLGNVINGGEHAKGGPDLQEFLVLPSAKSIKDAIFANSAVHAEVKRILDGKGIYASKGDEGGWAPQIDDELALDILSEAVEKVSSELHINIGIGLDMAASSLWKDPFYFYKKGRKTREQQIQWVMELIDRYGLCYVEDPLHEEDFDGFSLIKRDCMICGDDLFVTSPERIEHGAFLGAGNCVLIKPNQIGTLKLTKIAVDKAREKGYKCVISHRSGETTDDTIAHLAIAWEIPIIKTGIVGGERIAKLNELIRIEENISRGG